MESKTPAKFHELLKWDPEIARNRDWSDTLGRFGGPNQVMDFHDVHEWTDVPQRNITKL